MPALTESAHFRYACSQEAYKRYNSCNLTPPLLRSCSNSPKVATTTASSMYGVNYGSNYGGNYGSNYNYANNYVQPSYDCGTPLSFLCPGLSNWASKTK